MIVQIKDEISIEKWNILLQNNKYYSPFQTPEFYTFFNSISNQSAFPIGVIDKNYNLLALCLVTIQKENGIKGYFSRRAIIYGGPIFKTDNEEVVNFLLNSITKLLERKVIYIETRNFVDYTIFKTIFKKNNWDYAPYLNFKLNTRNTTIENILQNMKYNRRREIRISKDENAYYTVANTIKEVEILYKILSDLYKERVKIPLPKLEYFIKLFHSKIGKIFIVKHNDKIIGGAFCVFTDIGGIYTLYYCGERNYHKKIFPTHLAIEGVINFAIDNNLTHIDFMGAGKKGNEYGVKKYKSEFGGEQFEDGRFIQITNKKLYQLGAFVLKIKQKIK